MAVTSDQISGPLRAILPAVFAFAAGKGWIPTGDYGEVITGLVAGVAALWSAWSNRPSALAPKAS